MNMNPFNITFGINPVETVERDDELNEIIGTFNEELNGSHSIIITGPRGSGKTALLTLCKETLSKDDRWIVIEVNPEEDIQKQVAAGIYDKGSVAKLFLKAEFSFSFHGLGLSIEGDEPVNDILTLLSRMLAYLKKKGKKVLVALDEVSNMPYVRSFIHAFQILYREGYPIYFLMTGLYENVNDIENSRSLTFLYRAAKIDLKPLNIRLICRSYMDIFKIDSNSAMKLANFTKGYAFAYQLLGSLLYRSEKVEIDESIIDQFDIKIAEKSYDKIWDDLPNKEKDCLIALSHSKMGKNDEIMQELDMKKNELSVYKKRLSNKGLIDTSVRGVSTLVLPRFKEFILYTLDYEE